MVQPTSKVTTSDQSDSLKSEENQPIVTQEKPQKHESSTKKSQRNREQTKSTKVRSKVYNEEEVDPNDNTWI